MRSRYAGVLKEMGYTASVDDFRRALVELFGEWSIGELTYTRDEAAEFCQMVRNRLEALKKEPCEPIRILGDSSIDVGHESTARRRCGQDGDPT